MGGGSIKKPTQKRSINFTTETLETLDKLAAKNHTTTSELVRGYVEKGLSIEGSREDIDFIARIIRQEITAVYHVDEIKAIADHDTDRLAKMLMKIGKINGAIFFLLISSFPFPSDYHFSFIRTKPSKFPFFLIIGNQYLFFFPT